MDPISRDDEALFGTVVTAARVPALVSAAATHPGAPIRFRALGGLLCEAFVWYHNRPDLPDRDTAGAVMDVLFADQPAVRRVRKARPA